MENGCDIKPFVKFQLCLTNVMHTIMTTEKDCPAGEIAVGFGMCLCVCYCPKPLPWTHLILIKMQTLDIGREGDGGTN